MGKPKKIIFHTLPRVFLGSVSVIGIILVFFVYRLSKSLPTLEQISNHSVSQTTRLYDRTGGVLLYEITGGRERTTVPAEKIPRCLKEATIAVEDEKFYEGSAFDWRAIVRAFLVNLRRGKVVQGGSTITQQLAKNAFLTPEQTITRKIKEIILATKIHKHYSRDQILDLYINEIPYGPTIYGAGTASEAYFGKPLWEVNLAQCALLAAIPKAPSYYSPWGTHTKQLFERQVFVLKKMQALGKISEKELNEARTFTFTFVPQKKGIKAPHFAMAVQEYLTQKYGEDIVRKGGLRVITTLDWNLQQLAEKAVSDGARRNEELYGGTNAALVAEDPKTGDVLALVGSRDYFDTGRGGNFNVATQGLRQPGSALKPFVYLTVFEKGYSPETVVFDVPTEFVPRNPPCPPIPDFNMETKECFHPQNFDEQFRGPVSLRQALAQSINIPAVKVLYLAGMKDVIQNISKFGITTLADPGVYGLSLVLGGGAVRLVELVGAYGVLAADGIHHAQSVVLSAQGPDGRILESRAEGAARVISAQPARLVNNILSDIDARRGLFQSSLQLTTFPGFDVALKTGTSNDYRDAWTIGYTPALVVGVWAGNNDNSAMHKKGSSILAAVPIWNAFMKEAITQLPAESFIKPDPPSPGKPILRGDYLVNKELHSILFYVDKKDPGGPPPQAPANDPQFINWEAGVLLWGKANLADFSEYNKEGGSPSELPVVSIISPLAGARVAEEISVQAEITGSRLREVRILWNGEALESIGLGETRGTYTVFKTYRLPPSIKPQNELELRALTAEGLSAANGVVVYRDTRN